NPTIYEALAAKLHRAPTNAELKRHQRRNPGYTELPDVTSKHTAEIRKVASRAKVTFAVAASAYSASGGNLTKAIAVAKKHVTRKPNFLGFGTKTKAKEKAKNSAET